MKKSNQFTRQISSKIKFTKHQSHQINTNNIYGPKNSSISLITSPNRSKKNVNQDRLFSPSEGIKEKTHLNKQKIKSLQILSPNSKNKVKLDLDIKKTLFEKNSESFMYNKKLKSKDMENDEYLRSINVKSDRSPFKNKVLNKKLMISESKKKGKYDDNNNNITDINNNLDKFKEIDKDMFKTYQINQKDEILNKDINFEGKNKNNEDNNIHDNISINEENIDFQNQAKLIKQLLRTKNYQNFVKNLLNSENILINKNGKLIKFDLFNEDLYNLEFLDVYYKHHIPFIIMRPRLDYISRRKRAQKFGKIKEEESSNKNSVSELSNIANESGRYSSLSKSQLQNLNDSSSNEINENCKKKFSMQICHVPGSLVLTKMPQKTEENTRNKILNMAFNRAKDAARVIRRLEYSYGMRTNIILSKQIYQRNAKVIQGWWKDILFFKKNSKEILKLQAYIRGTMIRKAFKEVKNTYYNQLPFLKAVDKVISRRKLKIYFDKIVQKHGILKLLNKTIPYLNKVKLALTQFKNKRQFMREFHMFYTPKKNKCCYTKEIFDWEAKLKLYKIQAAVKFYLMHHNERIIKELFTNRYNPKLFYILKYGQNKDKLKKKLKNFRHTYLKFKELKLKATLPGNISNKFQFFKYILRKKIFNNLLDYYNDSVNNKDPKYQQKIKTKILLNRLNLKNNKNLLKKYFTKWNIKANYLDEYYRILKLDKLYIIETIFRYHKKYREKIFMFLLQNIQAQKKEQQKKGALNIFKLYNRNNGTQHDNNIIKRALNIWKKNAMKNKFENAAKIINKNAKIFLEKLYKNKLSALKKCFDIRNKIFKEKLRLWKFNSHKINHHFNSFINKTKGIIKTKQKLACLRKNLDSLNKRKKEYLRKYFNRFKTNTGIRKLVLINVQLCFFDENKEIISRDKYSMLEYVRNTNYIDVNKIKKNIILKQNFDFWKNEKKIAGLKRLCGKRINDLCTRAFYLEKLKFLHWNKIVQQQKFDKASRLIQKNYHIYLENKRKNNININNNEDNKISEDENNNIDNNNIIKEENMEQNSEE